MHQNGEPAGDGRFVNPPITWPNEPASDSTSDSPATARILALDTIVRQHIYDALLKPPQGEQHSSTAPT